MSDEQSWLLEIEDRESRATPGPWTIETWKDVHDEGCERAAVLAADDECVVGDWMSTCYEDLASNLAFIAHSRTDIPRLLAEVRALRAQVAREAAAREELLSLYERDIQCEREELKRRIAIESTWTGDNPLLEQDRGKLAALDAALADRDAGNGE